MAGQARCLAWEMVGYGRSIVEAKDRDISVAREGDYLHAWLDAIGVADVVLVGHDLGGGVAQIAAVRQPERCARLVLVNSICYDSWPIPSPKAMRAAGSVVERLAPYAETGGSRGFVHQIRSLRTQDTLAVADRLPALRVPARVVWGAADQFQKVRYGERLAADLGAGLTRLAGARHFVPEDHPEAVAEAVAAVLTERGGQPTGATRPSGMVWRAPDPASEWRRAAIRSESPTRGGT